MAQMCSCTHAHAGMHGTCADLRALICNSSTYYFHVYTRVYVDDAAEGACQSWYGNRIQRLIKKGEDLDFTDLTRETNAYATFGKRMIDCVSLGFFYLQLLALLDDN